MPRHALTPQTIDCTYQRFVARLPRDLRLAARDLPRRLALTEHPNVPWSAALDDLPLLGLPALLLDASPAPYPLVEVALEAHLFALIDAIGAARLADGQISTGSAAAAVLGLLGEASDASLRKLQQAAAIPALYRRETQQVQRALAIEREILSGQRPATWAGYREIALGRAARVRAVSAAAARAAGWSGEARALADGVTAGLTLGLRGRDDAAYWLEDAPRAVAWPVALLPTSPPIRLQGAGDRAARDFLTLERALADQRVLVRLLELSRDALRSAADAASALGAGALARWLDDQAALSGALALAEESESGAAALWAVERRTRRLERQADAPGTSARRPGSLARRPGARQ